MFANTQVPSSIRSFALAYHHSPHEFHELAEKFLRFEAGNLQFTGPPAFLISEWARAHRRVCARAERRNLPLPGTVQCTKPACTEHPLAALYCVPIGTFLVKLAAKALVLSSLRRLG